MSRGLLMVLTAALLAGCAIPVERPGALGERWGLSENSSEGVKLVLGVPDTDDVRLMLTCQPHSGVIDATVIARRRDGAVVELRSGAITNRYGGAGIADEERLGAVDLQLKLKASDPVLAHFADTGRLTVVFGSRRVVLPNAFAPAHDFLAACRRLP